MNHFHHLRAVALTSILLLSCGSSQQENTHADQLQGAKEKIAMDTLPPIPPNNCRVIATVESIDKTLKGANDKDPCGKAPCTATIKI